MPLLRALARCKPGKASARRTEAGNGGTSQPAWIGMKIKHAREKTNRRTESCSVDGSESRKNKSRKAGKTNRPSHESGENTRNESDYVQVTKSESREEEKSCREKSVLHCLLEVKTEN
jgi:hypothetical protein